MAGAFPHPDPFAPPPAELETGPIAETIRSPQGALRQAAFGLLPMPVQGLAVATELPNVLYGDHPPVPAASPAPLAAPPPGAPAPALPPSPPPPVAAPAPARRAGGSGAPGAPAQPDQMERQIGAAADAEAAGIQKTQEAKAEGADALSRVQGDLSTQQRMDAVELRERQEGNRQLQVAMEDQERGALQKARDYTIPDFWKGSEGAHVGSIISMAAGAIASGILGGPNGAMQIINKKTDDYFYRQKEKVDNLYKYAEQTGKMNDRTRLRYAQDLVNLQAQHAAVQQSIVSRIEAVKSGNQKNVDIASIDAMLAKAKQEQLQRTQDYRTNQAQLMHIARSDAETARHNRATEGIARQQLAASKAATRADDSLIYDAQGRPFANAQTPQAAQKFREQQTALADLGKAIGELRLNYGKGATLPGGITATGRERDAIMSRIVLAAKTVGQLGALSGPDLTLVQDLAGGNVGKYLGNAAGIGNLERLHETGVNTALAQIGAQPSPENRARFVAPGTPDGGAQSQAQQQIPVGARSTSGGRPIVMTAQGWQYAQ